MKLDVTRSGIIIIPEGPIDAAYIEEVLKLKKAGDVIGLVRQDGWAGTLLRLST